MESNKILSKTFLWMFIGLLLTGVVAWYTYSSGLFIDIVYSGWFNLILIIEVAVVLLFVFLFRKLPAIVVAIMYFAYAILNGVCLSTIFAVYELASIYVCFFSAAITFGAMALVGYKTSIDLSKISSMLYGVLFAGIVMSIVNIFLQREMLDIVISWVVLATFFGITAWDIQKIKNMEYYSNIDTNKIHIYGAMEIYLDFINIFLRLLRLFGKRR